MKKKFPLLHPQRPVLSRSCSTSSIVCSLRAGFTIVYENFNSFWVDRTTFRPSLNFLRFGRTWTPDQANFKILFFFEGHQDTKKIILTFSSSKCCANCSRNLKILAIEFWFISLNERKAQKQSGCETWVETLEAATNVQCE